MNFHYKKSNFLITVLAYQRQFSTEILIRKGFGGYVFRRRARVLLKLYGIRFKETIEEKTGTSNVFPVRIFLLLKQKCE